MIVEFDTSDIDLAMDKAFRETAIILNGEFVKAITAPIYGWPTGESPRDVVGTGRLRASQRYGFEGARKANYTWPVEYSAAVHNGYLSRGGNPMPARPWTEIALAAKDPTAIMDTLINAYL
jgi:hypothetical protein